MKKELKKEIERCEELLKLYEEIPEGFFGATMIKMSLQKARNASSEEQIKDALKDLESITG